MLTSTTTEPARTFAVMAAVGTPTIAARALMNAAPSNVSKLVSNVKDCSTLKTSGGGRGGGGEGTGGKGGGKGGGDGD